ncbi:MAG: M14 metallopeptidase family protein, partial [Salinimicrobium sp.]
MKENINVTNFLQLYSIFKEERLSGRYISWLHLEPLMQELESHFQIEEIGRSFLGIPIKSIRIGNGPVKVLGWSQMHGNESTTTKGLFDLFKLFIIYSSSPEVRNLLSSCTFLFIPMLNPDGAARYTRENVNKVDLNRDALERKEPESRVLREVFENFQPDYCLNLHDQRTIFSAGKEKKPATLSFLAPALDEEKSVPEHRLKAMQIITAINEALQQVIPGQVGRYGDDFNINCTGDTFQSLEVPTILFEAGHYMDDYAREETRMYFTFALFEALHFISNGDF